jgi:hypothetical protein
MTHSSRGRRPQVGIQVLQAQHVGVRSGRGCHPIDGEPRKFFQPVNRHGSCCDSGTVLLAAIMTRSPKQARRSIDGRKLHEGPGTNIFSINISST